MNTRNIDYAKVLLSKGRLKGLTNPSVTLIGNQEEGLSLWFDWEVTVKDRKWPRCNDQVMLIAYFPGEFNKEAASHQMVRAMRRAGQEVLELPISMAGKSIEVFIALVSEDKTEAANSQYLGHIKIP